MKKQDQYGRVAFNEHNANKTQQNRTIGKEPSKTPNKNRTG
jgi:hypothetical protein